MLYKVIGLMSGSALDGLDITYVHFVENAGSWQFEIKHATTAPYSSEWADKLKNAISLSALDYQLLNIEYGHFIGKQVAAFIDEHQLAHQVDLISSHGHTTFHLPEKLMTGQLGDGASIAAETGLPVISDLRAVDMALGGQGAPIVPMGEKLLLSSYNIFLNLGGIANISLNTGDKYFAFDVCAANRVMNLLSNKLGLEYDDGGKLASEGKIDTQLLEELNKLDYYGQPYPKSLANDFGTDTVFPMLENVDVKTALRTYSEHIAMQVREALTTVAMHNDYALEGKKMLVTGGGAFNEFLVKNIQEQLSKYNVEVEIPQPEIIQFKEALVMALLGILRWREEATIMSSVTGASRDSIGGAMWIG